MTTCPSCKYSISNDALKCPNCGFSLEETSGPTAYFQEKSGPTTSHSAESSDGARFTSGTILADRYRIISLLGRGGMGEVYKAEDLKLKQVVALKFLPDAVAMDGAALSRFQNEVRITRQISHPNVCRVYDIGEADGSHFLSMEFIDGEDLSLLLRRIGRLPGDKANEIARQICAGLAAAHENGVLHRDLKPANIMIDGRGKARVTDFGVAVVAKELMGREAASGTAQYMAPEQLKGQEVTQKSDIYSLGLVLYELFTGKKVYDSDNIHELMRLHESSSPTSPSSHVEHIDPLVERVIMRCLEKEPAKRPATAIQVAAALPGGDPLAAALAAGETPSPEMVAASGETTGHRPAIAVALLASIVVTIVIGAVIGNKVNWAAQLVRANSPEVLMSKAQAISRQLGYIDPPVGQAMDFGGDSTDYLRYLDQKGQSEDRWNLVVRRRPGPRYFWYRQSPRYLIPAAAGSFGWVTESDPTGLDISGMLTMNLDPEGRLLFFFAVPPQVDPSGGTAPAPDWTALFTAAGLDPTTFAATESTWTPLTVSDNRAAWTGAYPDQPDVPIRIEAAAYRGKPVYFHVVAPWTRPWRTEAFPTTTAQLIGNGIVLTIMGGLILGALLLATRNLRKGRGDRRGATRVSTFVFAVTMLSWVFGASHTPTFDEAVVFFFIAVCQALLLAALVWLFYIATEPFVRRRWPELIVTWSRVLGGSLRDPLVGRDMLIAVLAGAVCWLLDPMILNLARFSAGTSPQYSGALLPSTRQFIANGILTNLNFSIFIALVLFFLIFLMRVLVRRRWLAVIIFTVVWSGIYVLNAIDPMISGPIQITYNVITAVILLRCGLLAGVTFFFVNGVLSQVPVSTDLSAWYTGYIVSGVLIVLALAGCVFHTSLGQQKLFSGNLLED